MSNLICPFCNKPLQPTLRQSDEYWCENYDCPGTNIEWVGSQKLWQELITTRKALDKAIDLLKMLYADYNLDWAMVDSDKVYDFLEQITTLTKGDDNE